MNENEKETPLHATEQELTEMYDHTAWAGFPDLFAVLVIVSVVVFVKHFHNYMNRDIEFGGQEMY